MPRFREPTLLTEKNRIIRYMKAAGTYEDYFIDAIEHLAGLYLDLIEAEREYRDWGEGVTVSFVNKAGSEYRTINPILQTKFQILSECRAYESKLGLTPADHRKIMAATDQKPESSLGAALRMLSS